jgi:hypothetical protein
LLNSMSFRTCFRGCRGLKIMINGWPLVVTQCSKSFWLLSYNWRSYLPDSQMGLEDLLPIKT